MPRTIAAFLSIPDLAVGVGVGVGGDWATMPVGERFGRWPASAVAAGERPGSAWQGRRPVRGGRPWRISVVLPCRGGLPRGKSRPVWSGMWEGGGKGCPGTGRYGPAWTDRRIGGDLHRPVSCDTGRHCLDRMERSLNQRVRGSSPWRRTPSLPPDLGFLLREGAHDRV
jgi:hypothetical protein